MLRTYQILLSSALLSLTILGLAIIYSGGLMEVQIGPNNLIRIEGEASYERSIRKQLN